jgi:nitrogen regulatory protein PII
MYAPHCQRQASEVRTSQSAAAMGVTNVGWGQEYAGGLIPKIMLHLAVPADQVKPVIEAIIKGARTGKAGDGKIFVTPINEVVRIRTGERDHRALT